MGFFSRQAIEWMDRPLQDDRSYPSNTQQYHYYEVLEAEDVSTQDLVAALGEVAFRLQEQRPTILLSMLNEPKEIDPFKQLMLIA